MALSTVFAVWLLTKKARGKVVWAGGIERKARVACNGVVDTEDLFQGCRFDSDHAFSNKIGGIDEL